jgi:tetratricopeptide (TPR) repeat protein
MKKINFLSIILFFGSLFQTLAQDNVSINEVHKIMKTYPFSDPDPVPHPDVYYYPYFRFDGFAIESQDKEWKVVEMENKYIKVSVFPEIGGKIWGAVEKSTGNEFLYHNSVVKFRDIAMRGAWTSGGIEINFGIIGHAPTSATPVDYKVATNEDGSVSCYISATDLFTRTRWITEVNLPKDKAYFTTTTTWHNPTPLVQPYYQWMNAAYQVEGDLEFCFPGSHWIGHDGRAHDWPIDPEGRDISWYKNNSFGGSKSNHVLGGISEYYAGYWHDLDFGSGHYNQYGEKLGMKVFQWAHSRSGGIWEDLLTDTDGQYVELQSGRLFNQAGSNSTLTPFKHFGFEPYATDVFKEYWFPILNTKGVLKANPYGTINVEKDKVEQTIYFCPLQAIQEDIYIYYGNELQEKIPLDLEVLETWSTVIPVNAAESPVKIVLGDNKLIYSENREENISNRPMHAPDDFDWNSSYGLFLDGQHWVYQRKYARAQASLEKCIEKNTFFAPALNQLASLAYRKAGYEQGLEYASRSLSINTYDPEANFVFGLINKKTGKYTDAEDGFSVALLTPSYRKAAYTELAKLSMIQGRVEDAANHVLKILKIAPDDIEGNKLMAVIHRLEGSRKDAEQHLDKLQNILPVNHFVNFETYLINPNATTEAAFVAELKSELSHEIMMELALWYHEIGCCDEAIQLLKLSPSNPLVSLQLAYLLHHSGQQSEAVNYLNQALSIPVDFAFPFRPEHLEVLLWASQESDNWKPNYFLALLHWSFGEQDIARKWLEKCDDQPDYAPFYLAKADLFRDIRGYDPENDLKKANSLDPNQWRTYASLIDFYLSGNKTREALDVAEKSVKKFSDNHELKYTYAKCLMANGQYSACRKALAETVILPNEGARYGRVTYQQACLMEGVDYFRKRKYNSAIKSIKNARLWPENLGVGKPFDVDERIENYFEAVCQHEKRNKDLSDQLYKKVIQFNEEIRPRRSSVDYLYLKSLLALDRSEEVREFMNSWSDVNPDDPMLHWCKAMINGDSKKADIISKQINTESGGTPWDPQFADTEFEIIKALSIAMSEN